MPFLRRKKDENLPPEVRFVRTERSDTATYHVHSGPDRQAALTFLRRNPVPDELVYTIVETPEGNFGRDLIYLFHEADGSTIELAGRPRAQQPTPSDTRCGWCSFFVVPTTVAINDQWAGTVQVYRTYDELAALVKTGGGFHCRSCSLLQCAVCSGLADATSRAREPRCLACGGGVSVHEKLGAPKRPFAHKPADPEDDQVLTLPADPLGDELWGLAPLPVPWRIDVAAFLARPELPYLWPENDRYTGYIGTGERAQRMLRASWTNVFLHHPNPDVVLQLLRTAPPDGMLSLSSLADLLGSPIAEAHVKEEAARAFWQLPDGGVTYTLNVLLSRGTVPSGYDTGSVHQAVGLLRAACPQGRLGWFDTQLAGPEDD
ncbi:hypothetical protein ACFZB9_22870 [Kitasatospora sp. NPDC008050]|uniref:hypothetical protein n=1 Tax=Kitasatospora sp. NPDC008050 TaxID=3364021 RepID=UPI0036E553F1